MLKGRNQILLSLRLLSICFLTLLHPFTILLQPHISLIYHSIFQLLHATCDWDSIHVSLPLHLTQVYLYPHDPYTMEHSHYKSALKCVSSSNSISNLVRSTQGTVWRYSPPIRGPICVRLCDGLCLRRPAIPCLAWVSFWCLFSPCLVHIIYSKCFSDRGRL